MSELQRQFKGIWIPSTLWLSEDLSIQEKVILAEIDSLEDDIDGCFASNKYFAKFFGLSETRVSHIISDLNKKGYVQIEKYNKNGKTIREIRLNRPPYPLERVVKNDYTGWSKMTIPTGQKRLPYNIVDNKEDITINPPYNPPKGNEGVDELFNLFWKSYPRKVSKGNAEKWFKKNKPTKELVDTMISKIDLLKETEQWKKNDGQFIPYPATWLNAKGWEDEIKNSNTSNFKKPTKGFIPNKIVTFDNGAKGYFDEEGKVHYT